MINIAACAKAPVDIVGIAWIVQRSVTLISLAETISTRRFTAAIIVGNYVVFVVHRVFTGADPRYW